VRQRPVLVTASLALLLGLGAALLLRPDRRSAWDQAALTRDLPPDNAPDRRGLWADQLRPLLREADALGPEPSDPAALLSWREAQCNLNRRLQELQRRFGRPVETARQMGRPPACEQLEGKRWSPSGMLRPTDPSERRLAACLHRGNDASRDDSPG